MTEEVSLATHLSVAMTTSLTHTETTAGNTKTSSFERGVEFYFQCAVLVMGIVGTAANGLILYAMVASNQHTKQVLIFHQNFIDIVASFFLVIKKFAEALQYLPQGTCRLLALCAVS